MPAADPAYALRPLGRSLRLLRSTAASLACVLAAAVGHLTAGGRLAPAAVLVVAAGAGAVAWLLSARRVTAGQTLGLLVLCQVCVHLTASGHDMTMSAGMIAGHLVATVVSAGVLARGERFVWQLAERLGLRLLPTGWDVVTPPAARRLHPVVVPRTLHDVRLAHSRSLRGPPSGL